MDATTSDGVIDLPDGGSVLDRFVCVGCGKPFIPRTKNHTRTCGAAKCHDRSLYLNSRKKLHRVIAQRENRARWGANNGGYYLARLWLKKHKLLTPETQERVAQLKGKGAMSALDALAACGLGAIAPSPASAPAKLVAVDRNWYTGRARLRSSEPGADAWAIGSPAIADPIARAVRLSFRQRGIQCDRVRDHGGARVLHGALHRALGVGHSIDRTPFALVLPEQRRSGLWFVEFEAGLIERLPSAVLLASDDAPHELIRHEIARLRAPRPREAGQYRARVIAAGPLVLKRSERVIAKRAKEKNRPFLHALQTEPTDLVGALERVAARVGLQVDSNHIIARVIAHDLDEIEGGVRVGGHWQMGARVGRIECMVGHIDLELNAVGRWLLDVAALVGLGSKTAIGFGRVRVEDL